MKIEIIVGKDEWNLQEKVNLYLKYVDDSKIIDIKYQGVGNHPNHSTDYPSVMIIMKQ